MPSPRRSPASESVKLRPADPFDLIRWLARSQGDPRKAIAELVQNSIDANATTVRIERRRIRHFPAVILWDDGEGILPEMGRDDALRTIATNIGHSRKRGLSPRERHDQVVAGKYGIGLLGFWSVGRLMEIRSRVKGSPASVLRLEEDKERAEIARHVVPIAAPDTYTEIVIIELHEPAQRALSGRRLADYLSAELRGSILASGISIEIVDGFARGSAQKRFAVVPRRFTGERLTLPTELDVPGYAPLRLEIYVGRGEERPTIQVSCAGTLVADDLAELGTLGLTEGPWTGRSLVGLIDFPSFNVPPGTRRGVMPDAAAAAFVCALERLRPLVEAELGRLDKERGQVTAHKVAHELRRALRGLRNRLPQYELPASAVPDEPVPSLVVPGGPLEVQPDQQLSRPVTDSGIVGAEAETGDEGAGADLHLFPPGPLAKVRVFPEFVRLAPGSERRVRAVALDDTDRRIEDGVTFRWTIDATDNFEVRADGARGAVFAQAQVPAGLGITTSVRVHAEQGQCHADGSALVVVEEQKTPEGGFGIPEPELIEDTTGVWRSRFDGQRWQVNAAHEDYVSLRGDTRGRFRYLLALLAKEIALRTHGVPGSEAVLDSLVEILAHAERNLQAPVRDA